MMSNSNNNEFLENRNGQTPPPDEHLSENEDMLMEQILENMNTTPLGQVLKKITSLPEIRREKVLDIRKQLTSGKYNCNSRLDFVVDKVLEDLIA
jgi:hypothetical protein